MKEIIKKYSNGDVTVIWEPAKCIHSTICFKGLPGVFNPRKRPWVNIEGADSKRIMEQVDQCPSGALSYQLQEDVSLSDKTISTLVEVMPNGPLLVHAALQVKDARGDFTNRDKVTAFCRCGGSNKKPYCDGSHKTNHFSDD